MLNEKQKAVKELVFDGLLNHEIGAKLGISENTVKYHLTRIFDQEGVDGRLELMAKEIKLLRDRNV